MSDRDDTHEDAINGEADAQGPARLDGTQRGDDVEHFDDELDSETAALLGASLRPVGPPAAIRASLLETIAREPQTERVDQADHTAEKDAGDRDAVGGSNGGSGSDGDSVDSEVLSLDAHRRRRSAWRCGTPAPGWTAPTPPNGSSSWRPCRCVPVGRSTDARSPGSSPRPRRM